MANNTSDAAGPLEFRLDDRVLAGRYRVANVVSAGANTIVTDAFDTDSNQPVTLKLMQPELVESGDFRREFRRRAEVATALSHPNIAAVLDWGEVDVDEYSTVFWVVEHLSGGSLRDLFDRGRLLEPSQALVVGLEACRALDAAHQRGIVHTELTPSKLVFGDDRRLRIIDFGMAELLGRSAWDEPATVAPHVARYASPEQALGVDVDAKTDVYALALSLLEAVTGSIPFSADSTVSTLSARVGKLMPVSADLGSLAAVLERAGRPEADDRSTAAEFGRALVQAAERQPRPEPIPIVSAGLFDTSQMRRPSDPTGGIERPVNAQPAAAPVEPDRASDDDSAETEAVAAEVSSPVDDVVLAAPEPEPPIEVAAAVPDVVTANEPAPSLVASDDLVIIADVADPPSGSVEVAKAGTDAANSAGAANTAEATATTAATTTAATVAPQTAQMPITAAPTPDPVGIYDDEGTNRRTGAIVGLSLFVVVGLAAIAFAGFLLLRTKSYEVPDLTVGVNEAVALNEVAGNEWNVIVERERSDDQPVVGNVIRTFPEAGAVLDEGAEFRLFVSQGPLFRTLPDVSGSTAEAARVILESLQLSSFVEAEQFDEEVPIGVVLSWRVDGDVSKVVGDEVLPGASVVLTVSKGPAPRLVPAVTGLTLEEANAAAANVRLTIVPGEEVFSDDVEVGRIVSQDPAPDTEVARDSSFAVQISKGLDLVELPDLEGLSYTDAQTALTDAGFTIGSLLGTTDGFFESQSITAETVGDTGLYRRGTSVDLIFLGV